MTYIREIPSGFYPMELVKGFNQQFGQMYDKEEGGRQILAFRVAEHHLNPFGALHGGAIATFADFQIMPACRIANVGILSRVSTITLTIDCMAPGKIGDWVELHVQLQKRTKTMMFTFGEILVDGELIARTTGIYRVRPSFK